MKTIRQIADEIGVSKQTVYKRYKGKLHTVCAPYAHTEQGVLYIEEQGETLIKQDFLQKECSVGAHTYAHTERSNGEVLEQSENVGVIAVLQTTIDTLQGQLAIKDKQIEDLNARLSESNAALVAAQQTCFLSVRIPVRLSFMVKRDSRYGLAIVMKKLFRWVSTKHILKKTCVTLRMLR